MNSNYTAAVVKLDIIRDHPNANKLRLTNIFGNSIIVGADAKEGDVGLYFPLESQLGKEFTEVNDLIRRKDDDGKPAGGMFDVNRRVRAQKFRGEKSMGFWCPISYLYNLTTKSVEVGDELEEHDSFVISTKYVIPAKGNGSGSKQGKKAKESRVVPEQFHFHFDTAQLGRNLFKLQPDSLIALSWKFHGTSGIAGNVLTKRRLPWYETVLKFIGVAIIDTTYDYVYSSRRVIKNDDKDYEHFYAEDIWSKAGETFRNHLHAGETCYFEIVGFTSDGGAIQGSPSGAFDYKCRPTEFETYIYRITQTNIDGVVTELPWNQVMHRAEEIGGKVTPSIYYGRAVQAFDIKEPTEDTVELWRDAFFNKLSEEYVYDQDSRWCNNPVPEEGIVIRIENGDGIENYKLKSYRFLSDETKMLDAGEADMESAEGEQK